jgi:O-succinylbenzoic acid--CoA ligase
MFQLTFGNQTFQRKEDFELIIQDFPAFAKAALQFCSDWLSGKNTFTQQTSGSTGVPKKIEIYRAQMTASAKATQEFFKTDENTELLCCLDPNYIAGKMMLVRAMVWDCPIHLTEPKSNPLLEVGETPDFLAMVPLQVESCIRNKRSLLKLKAIRHLIIGGAPISPLLKKELIANDIKAYQTYGMTETVSHIALAKIEAGEMIYKTLPDVQIGVDDRNALWVISQMSRPDKIQTNDLIEMVGVREFKWLGRIDFVINSGGIKINPEQLEIKSSSAISRFYPDSDFFFLGEKDEKFGEKVVLYIENEKSSKDKTEVLLSMLSEVLSKFELPKVVYVLKEFDRTATSKIDKLKTSSSK